VIIAHGTDDGNLSAHKPWRHPYPRRFRETVLANSFQGRGLNRPNDVVVKIRRRDLFHQSTASENWRDFAHSEFLRDRLKKNSKECSSMAKLKRKRRSYQVETEEASLP
jgi:hypothetical protein